MLISCSHPEGRALDHRGPINVYVSKDCAAGGELRQCMLEDSEWEALVMVSSWLKIFREATVLMSTTKRPMLSSTHAIFRGLQARLQDIITGLPSDVELELRDGLVASHLKLSEYFAKFDESAYCLWACRE
jgi:hypothetical protein